MAFAPPRPRDRMIGAAIAILVQVAIGVALLSGFSVALPGAAADALKMFSIAPPPPTPERPVPPKVRSKRPEGRAAPPNLRATPKPITALLPVVPPPVPPVMQAPTKAAEGYAPTAGAADVRGPGTGAGGEGDGLGGGGMGDGDDGGWNETPPLQTRGQLRDSDFPDEVAEAGVSGTVAVRYVVLTSGRVGECTVTRSSGSRALDALTCRLIRERFRFDPSRDERGRPVESTLVENHSWDLERVPGD